ncbi:M3 family oligoendopeptidase [Gloeobacter morelensis]|uniref:M3 family oligoendopeptidase n=1 Tax=Gloeobacter morelensis MG652769 TaxID=2781736 RepID=A0ABY3PL51_9CYAN|nr:M3 family oligoendopeptidase [Gloeobacter morelensis]UFP94390.1 M3 family oligoendopeptidase [Gloeobacter morelensis MG652769]
MKELVDFSDIQAEVPTYEQVASEYDEIRRGLSQTDWQSAFSRWDALRRRLASWSALAYLRFSQDTANSEFKQARDYCDELSPRLTDLEVQLKRQLLGDPRRTDFEAHIGPQAFALWQADVTTFDPAIEADLVAEARLAAEYTELLATAKLEFAGEMLNLEGIDKYTQHADREVRHQAQRVKWQFFEQNAAALDRIFDDLVRLRHTMARKLGFDNYIALGYRRMQRIDYDAQDVARYRDQVAASVVPLAEQLIARQAQNLGVEQVYFWDEPVFDPKGNPAPLGDHDWMVEQARAMFNDMAAPLGEFFEVMVEHHLLDLKNRPAKAGGGFCTSFPSYGLPYIFANFNGTKHDVEVFTHEMGHAFQNWQSRKTPVYDYLWPTLESCEIHSMSLEFLTWPYMDRFFGAEAERFRTIHLAESLLFLPYGVAVDHFQQLVYAHPEATPAERRQLWLEMERRYLPWRDYGDLAYPAAGGRWQLQRHIYGSPFYYIDYTLAGCCALQFWAKAQSDYAGALADYVALCRRGGEAPFQQLVRSAGLVSPLAPGALGAVVERAREALALPTSR